MVCNSPCSRVREGSIHPGPAAAVLRAEGNTSQCTLGLELRYSRGISRLFGKTGQSKKKRLSLLQSYGGVLCWCI